MIHFYMVLSGNPQLEFQAELFLRSLDLFGKVPYCLTVCQGPGETIANDYVRKAAQIVYRPRSTLKPEWYTCLGCVPQRGDITIYTDADIMVLGDLSYIERTCLDSRAVCGVPAYSTPNNYGKIGWKKLFEGCGVPFPGLNHTYSVHEGKCPFYVNLGFVAIPSSHVPYFNEAMPRFLEASDKVYPGHYHRPQFAMCLSAESSGLNKVELPLWCNYPDLFKFLDRDVEKAITVHMLQTKSDVKNWRELKEFVKKPPRNGVVKRVQSAMSRLLRVVI